MPPNENNGMTAFPTACENRKYIGYRGLWYDVTDFIPKHPGGDIIQRFVGQDATHVIETAHRKHVMKHRKPLPGNAGMLQPCQYSPTPFGQQMIALHRKLEKEGYYDQSFSWFLMKFSIPIFLAVATVLTLFKYGHIFSVQCLCSITLGLFFHQSGFLMHDLMHSHAFQNYKIDERFGVFFGTLCYGISARWWKDEHTVHHALTNTIDHATGFVDPQAKEDAWAQNEMLFPLMKDKLQHTLIKIQYFTFVPLCLFVGRIAIIVDSFREEKRRDVWVALILHFMLMATMLSFINTWNARFWVYYAASVGEGILHVQLLMNHYSKPFYEKETMHKKEFFEAMVEANINIVSPRWMDWFHGGLNFHIEHHCFPRLPRNRYREVSTMIKKICAENGIHYDECGFVTAVKRTLSQLKSVSDIFEAATAYEPTTKFNGKES